MGKDGVEVTSMFKLLSNNHLRADGELMNLSLQGDEQAWAELLNRYGGLIYSIAWKCQLPPEDAADVFQSVCLVMLEDLDKLKEKTNLIPWLAAITLRQCRHLVDLDQTEGELSATAEAALLPDEEVQHLVQQWSTRQGSAGKDEAYRCLTEEAGAGDRSTVEPPDWLAHQAMSLYAWHKTKPQGNAVKHIPAFLLLDSYTEGQTAGFRSVGPMPRQMLYRAGDYHLNLSLNHVEQGEQAESIDIMGQPLPLSADLGAVVEADVELVRDSGAAHATKANEFGAFILDGVQEGTYELRIKLKGEEIRIPRLEAIVRTPRKPVVN